MAFIRVTDLDLTGKRVLIRCDLNVPVHDGIITDDTRIKESIPTIRHAAESGAVVLVVSHFGRPEEGVFDAANSLEPVAGRLSKLLGRPVRFVQDWIDGVQAAAGDVVLCENVRFLKGEKKDNAELAQKMAKLCDVYVNDAFGAAHRAQASTHAIAQYAPVACAGMLMAAELDALEQALAKPARPMLAIVGGSKVSTKLTVLKTLADKVDHLIVGGGIANTFLLASGYNIGASLVEKDLVEDAKAILTSMQAQGRQLPLPVDVYVGKKFDANEPAVLKPVGELADDDMIFDVGPKTAAQFAELVSQAGTIVWNGPVGVFEFDQFGYGTQTLAGAIARAKGFSIAGGGDTVAAINKYAVRDQVSYISTGGGAFLEFLEGKALPAVAMLIARAQQTV